MADFTKAVSTINEDLKKVGQSNELERKSAAYSQLSQTLQRFESTLREYTQDLTHEDITKIIKKLKNGDNLTSDELEYVKLWIVGDADNYTRLENNFEDWNKELMRLVHEINRHTSKEPDFVTAAKLRGILRDAIHTVEDIFYFLQQKDRIEKFTQSTKSLSPESRAMLVNILERKIKSADF